MRMIFFSSQYFISFFHDSTLQEMVKSTPTTLGQFSHIGGVGQAKLERYGEHFIKVIQEHLEST